ncbi:hypothetical protein [Spirosoma fluminis]
MLVTICTIRQLPQAFALGDSFIRYSAESVNQPVPVLIGLADDPANLPPDFIAPYPLLPFSDVIAPEQLQKLSAVYTPTELKAACKPLFLSEVFRRYPAADHVLYADPNITFYAPTAPIWEALGSSTVLLTPLITQKISDTAWPDEKFFQNVGLYSSDFMAFRRSTETDRLLAWWDDRVRTRAHIDFCSGLCTDQLWLMHVPVFFKETVVVKDRGWHVALWNLAERRLQQAGPDWLIDGPISQSVPLLFVNFKGLLDPDEGFFPHQTRIDLKNELLVTELLTQYKQTVQQHTSAGLTTPPAFGQQPEPNVIRGWRRSTINGLMGIKQFIDQVPLPVIR